ncbi:MAG: hypothetical protein AAFU54_24935 [Chloroflexota bacterium]
MKQGLARGGHNAGNWGAVNWTEASLAFGWGSLQGAEFGATSLLGFATAGVLGKAGWAARLGGRSRFGISAGADISSGVSIDLAMRRDTFGGAFVSNTIGFGLGETFGFAGDYIGRGVDDLATHLVIRSDLNITRNLARAARQKPLNQNEVTAMISNRGFVGRWAQNRLDRRGYQVLYRGTDSRYRPIRSYAARADVGGSLEQSQALYNRLRAGGFSDSEIAGYTAQYNYRPVRSHSLTRARQSWVGTPIGSVGIPTSRILGISANPEYATDVVYALRLQQGTAVQVQTSGWTLSTEHEWVIFNEVPEEAVFAALDPLSIPPLKPDDMGLLITFSRSK